MMCCVRRCALCPGLPLTLQVTQITELRNHTTAVECLEGGLRSFTGLDAPSVCHVPLTSEVGYACDTIAQGKPFPVCLFGRPSLGEVKSSSKHFYGCCQSSSNAGIEHSLIRWCLHESVSLLHDQLDHLMLILQKL